MFTTELLINFYAQVKEAKWEFAGAIFNTAWKFIAHAPFAIQNAVANGDWMRVVAIVALLLFGGIVLYRLVRKNLFSIYSSFDN